MRQKRHHDYFTSGDIAREVKISVVTVRRYLSLRCIEAKWGGWHRFDKKEFDSHVSTLNGFREKYPCHLLRALKGVSSRNGL